LVGTQTARINPCAMYESVAHVSARSKNLPIRVADDLRQFAMLRVAEPPSISYSMQTAELLQQCISVGGDEATGHHQLSQCAAKRLFRGED